MLAQHTISSLHIGHTIRELAAAAAWAEPCSSRATREARSSLSVDRGVPDVCELSDTELSEGESGSGLSRPGLSRGCLLVETGGGGAKLFPLPRTRPPPRLLRAAISIVETDVHASRVSPRREPTSAFAASALDTIVARWQGWSAEGACDRMGGGARVAWLMRLRAPRQSSRESASLACRSAFHMQRKPFVLFHLFSRELYVCTSTTDRPWARNSPKLKAVGR